MKVSIFPYIPTGNRKDVVPGDPLEGDFRVEVRKDPVISVIKKRKWGIRVQKVSTINLWKMIFLVAILLCLRSHKKVIHSRIGLSIPNLIS